MHTEFGKKIINAVVFMFFYLQFASFVSFYTYWITIGIDPSGYFSIQDILVVSLDTTLQLFALMFVVAIISYSLGSDVYFIELESNALKGFLSLLFITVFLLWLAYKLPLNWDKAFFFSLTIAAYLIKYPIGFLISPMRLDEIFGSKHSAYVYSSMMLLTFIVSFPGSVFVARSEVSAVVDKVLVYKIDEPKAYLLIGKIGSYHVAEKSSKEIVIIPNGRVDRVVYSH